MTLGISLLVLGLVIILGSFLFAALNMVKTVKTGSFDSGFTRHVGAIVGVAVGAFVSTLGALLLLIRLANK